VVQQRLKRSRQLRLVPVDAIVLPHLSGMTDKLLALLFREELPNARFDAALRPEHRVLKIAASEIRLESRGLCAPLVKVFDVLDARELRDDLLFKRRDLIRRNGCAAFR
jgi:hypothetical protein